MKKIVFTGGPSAGKTSLINKLKATYSQDSSIFFAPEIASMLLGNGFPRCAYSENLIFQQKAIFNTQLEMENLLIKEENFKLCFFDRGILDAFAYVEKDSLSPNEKESYLSRYDIIFHLEVAPPFKYTNQNNKARTESYEEALKLENELKKLWQKHPQYQFIKAEQTFDEKYDFVFNEFLKEIIEKN